MRMKSERGGSASWWLLVVAGGGGGCLVLPAGWKGNSALLWLLPAASVRNLDGERFLRTSARSLLLLVVQEKYIICPLFYLISPLSKKKGA